MKLKCHVRSLLLVGLLLLHCTSSPQKKNRDVVFQTTTIAALLEGNYNGNLTISELLKHGDFGLGTFQALDGEMIVLNDTVFQIHYNGNVYFVHDSVKTPFAVITDHNSDLAWSFQKRLALEDLKKELDLKFKSKNMIYTIQIDGVFEYIKTRSVPKQSEPYPKLADVIKHQSVFEFENIKGTIVGFRFPEYLKEINVVGYHFHFIDVNRKCGGHLLDCITKKGNVQIDEKNKLFLVLPENTGNRTTKTSDAYQRELKEIE